ncbi:MAG: hypothetical protein AB7K24_14315, partial [Gemmataceae bacterium]
QCDGLPFKAHILKDQDEDAYRQRITNELFALMESFRAGREEAWRNGRPWLATATDQRVIASILSMASREYLAAVYECESCGRLFVPNDVDATKMFVYSRVDANPFAGVLRSASPTPPRRET